MRTRTKPRNDARASTDPVDPDPQLDWVEHFFRLGSAIDDGRTSRKPGTLSPVSDGVRERTAGDELVSNKLTLLAAARK
jgi:hypothetical protein